jgi:hypothetical protein
LHQLLAQRRVLTLQQFTPLFWLKTPAQRLLFISFNRIGTLKHKDPAMLHTTLPGVQHLSKRHQPGLMTGQGHISLFSCSH